MKAAKKASSINEIAKVHTRLVQSKDDLTAAEARHGEIENEYGDLLERFVVTTVLIPVQAAHQNEMMSPAVTE